MNDPTWGFGVVRTVVDELVCAGVGDCCISAHGGGDGAEDARPARIEMRIVAVAVVRCGFGQVGACRIPGDAR